MSDLQTRKTQQGPARIATSAGNDTPTRSLSVKRKGSINVPSRTGSSGRLPEWASSPSAAAVSGGSPKRMSPRRPSTLAVGGSLIDVGDRTASADLSADVVGSDAGSIHTKAHSAYVVADSPLHDGTDYSPRQSPNHSPRQTSRHIVGDRAVSHDSSLADVPIPLSIQGSASSFALSSGPKRTTTHKAEVETLLDDAVRLVYQPDGDTAAALQGLACAHSLAVKDNDLILQSKSLSNIACLLRRNGKNHAALAVMKAAWDTTASYIERSCLRGVSVWLRMVVDIVEHEFDGEIKLNSRDSDRNFDDDEYAKGPPLVIWFMQMLTNMGNCHFSVGKVDSALKYYTLCLDLTTNVLEEYPLPADYTTTIGKEAGSRNVSDQGRALNRSMSVRVSVRDTSSRASRENKLSTATTATTATTTTSVAGATITTSATATNGGPRTPLSYLHRESLLAISRAKTLIGVCYHALGVDEISIRYQQDALGSILSYMKGRTFSPSLLRPTKPDHAGIAQFAEVEACIKANLGSAFYAKGDIPLSWQFHDNAKQLYTAVGNTFAASIESVSIGGLFAETASKLDSLQWVRMTKNLLDKSKDSETVDKDTKEMLNAFWKVPSFNAQLERLKTGNSVKSTNPDNTPYIYGIQMLDKSICTLFDQEENLRRVGNYTALTYLWMNIANAYFHLQNPYLGLYFLSLIVEESASSKIKDKQALAEVLTMLGEDAFPTLKNAVGELGQTAPVISDIMEPHVCYLIAQGFYLLSLYSVGETEVYSMKNAVSGADLKDFGSGYDVFSPRKVNSLLKALNFAVSDVSKFKGSNIFTILEDVQHKFSHQFSQRWAINDRVMKGSRDFDTFRQLASGLATLMAKSISVINKDSSKFDATMIELSKAYAPLMVAVREHRPSTSTGPMSDTSTSSRKQLSSPVLKSPLSNVKDYFDILRTSDTEIFNQINELFTNSSSTMVDEFGVAQETLRSLSNTGVNVIMTHADIFAFFANKTELQGGNVDIKARFSTYSKLISRLLEVSEARISQSLCLCAECEPDIINGFEMYLSSLEKKGVTDLKRTNTRKSRLGGRTFTLTDRARSTELKVPDEEANVEKRSNSRSKHTGSDAKLQDTLASAKSTDAVSVGSDRDSVSQLATSAATRKKQRSGVIDFQFPAYTTDEGVRRFFHGPAELWSRGHKSKMSENISVSDVRRSRTPSIVEPAKESTFSVISSNNHSSGFHVHGLRSSTSNLAEFVKEEGNEAPTTNLTVEPGRLSRGANLQRAVSTSTRKLPTMSFPCSHYADDMVAIALGSTR